MNELPKLGSRVYVDRTASVTGSVFLGDDVTAGHGAILHACTIGDRCLAQDTRWQA